MESEVSHIAYLTIFNPDLESRDEFLGDQIVFNYDANGTPDKEQRVRDIGLLQGMTTLSGEFSAGQTVSSIETENSRTVLKLVENDNWWIAMRINYGVGETGKNISPPSVLLSQLIQGYRNWRLHHGPFSSVMDIYSREVLVQNLGTYWTAFAENFPIFLSDQGCLDVFTVDNLRLANGSLKSGSVQALESVLDRDPEILHVIISHENSTDGIKSVTVPVRQGSVLSSSRSATSVSIVPSVADEASNVNMPGLPALEEIRSETSLDAYDTDEPADSSEQQQTQAESENDIESLTAEQFQSTNGPDRAKMFNKTTKRPKSSVLGPGLGCVWHGGIGRQSSVCDLYNWVSKCQQGEDDHAYVDGSGVVVKAVPEKYRSHHEDETSVLDTLKTLGKFMPSMEEMKSAITITNYFGNGSTKHSPTTANGVSPLESKIEDIVESRFLVGLDGNLEEEGSIHITKKSIFFDIDNDAASTDSNFVKCRLTIYRRRPYTFALVYREGSSCLEDAEYYKNLHRRLASLSEPLSSDLLSSLAAKQHQNPNPHGSFQYIVADFTHRIVQSNLAAIPPMLSQMEVNQLDSHRAESILQERWQCVQFHMLMCKLLDIPIPDAEQERIIRTDKNWWAYMARLPGNRVAVLSQKWHTNASSRDRSGSLGTLSKEAKDWLSDYMNQGHV